MLGRIKESRYLGDWLAGGWNKTPLSANDIYYFDNCFPLDTVNKILIKHGFDCIDVSQDAINFKDWSIPFKYILNHEKLGQFEFTGSLFYGKHLLKKL